MSYKNILVQVDERPRCEARVNLALNLATRFEAHLTALAVVPPPRYPRPTLSALGPEIAQQQMREGQASATEALARFTELARVNGWSSVETRRGGGDLITATSLHARYNDLVVIGQRDPDDPAADFDDTWQYPETAAMALGRPVLVVPYAGRFERLGQNVVIAWDAGREATRAVTDALPLLRQARRVTVLVINGEKGQRHGDEPGADIALYLARHGVKVEVSQQQSGDLSVGLCLLSRMADLDADLLVMGAYGHSRLREMVLGGVTRTILSSMTAPVLMSH